MGSGVKRGEGGGKGGGKGRGGEGKEEEKDEGRGREVEGRMRHTSQVYWSLRQHTKPLDIKATPSSLQEIAYHRSHEDTNPLLSSAPPQKEETQTMPYIQSDTGMWVDESTSQTLDH